MFSLSLWIAKILCCRHSTVYHEPNQNKPCDGNRLWTPSPYNFSTSGVHPLHTSVLGIWLTKTLQLRYFGCAPPPYFGSQIIVPWDIPHLPFLGPLFSFSFCPDWADTLSVSGVWTPVGRMCDSPLTSKRLLLSGNMIRMVGLYSSCVVIGCLSSVSPSPSVT